jgi:hypothetical protein
MMSIREEFLMKMQRSARTANSRNIFDARVAAYLSAAGAVGTALASEAQAIIVSNTTVQPFGIDGAVPIDFDSDGQVDFEIDHDNIDLGNGTVVDFLQIDKNDTNGGSPGENPCPINVFDTFDTGGGFPNNTADAAYVITGAQGDYPAALSAGDLIGPASSFDFQETDNFQGSGQTIRANRLIDEDAGQCDEAICGLTAGQTYDPVTSPNFIGLGGEVRYLGVRFNPQSVGGAEYGWIGIRITDEANATGEVVGWGYETSGAAIRAGQVPEPGTIVTALVGFMMAGCLLWRRVFGRR